MKFFSNMQRDKSHPDKFNSATRVTPYNDIMAHNKLIVYFWLFHSISLYFVTNVNFGDCNIAVNIVVSINNCNLCLAEGNG